MKTKTWDIHTENSKENLTFAQISARCPGINVETLRNRLKRGERDLSALQAKTQTKQQIARKTRASLRRAGYTNL